jgi:ABC-type multidrug transport system fused ATPase/permease subunit
MARQATDVVSAGVIRVYSWAWQIFEGVRWQIFAVGFLSLIVVQIGQYSAQLLVHALGLLQGGESGAPAEGGFFSAIMPGQLAATVVLFAFISVALIGLQFWDRYANFAIDTGVTYRLQEKLHEKILRLGPAFHATHGIGPVQMMMGRYVNQSAGVMRELLVFPLVNGLSFMSAGIYLWANLFPLFSHNAGIAPLIIFGVVAMPVVAWQISAAVRAAIRVAVQADVAVNEELVNSLRRPVDIQLMGAQAARQQAFAARTRAALAARVRSLRRSQLANQIEDGMPQLLTAAILAFAIVQVAQVSSVQERIELVAAIVGVIQFLPRMLAPVQQTISFYNLLMGAIPGIMEVMATLSVPEEVTEPANAVPLCIEQGTVSVEDVEIDRPDGAPILSAVSHSFEGGRIWGVVGPSGSGKSTLLATIARAFDPARGRVCIDGTDIRLATLDSLRRTISFLGQFPPFLDGTLRDNLNLAHEPVSDERLLAACAAAGMQSRLESMAAPGAPLDLQIYAEPNKGALAGGERRLLAMARILAHPGQIILLDEPTAGVSADLKGALAALIKHQLAGATTIVVDHDMGFIAEIADCVLCMDKGRVVGSIPRDELFERPSVFLDLWKQEQTLHGAGMEVTSFPAASREAQMVRGPVFAGDQGYERRA